VIIISLNLFLSIFNGVFLYLKKLFFRQLKGFNLATIVERGFVPDEDYYKKTIALLIIYRYLLSRPDNKQYANGKASVIAYAMAIMSSQSFGRFDLLKVWKNQGISCWG